MSGFDDYSYGAQGYPPPRRRHSPNPVSWLIALVLGGVIGAGLFRYVLNRGTPETQPRAVAPAAALVGDEQATVDLFKRISPSVVYITTLQQRANAWTRRVTEVPSGTGSGFIWDDAGHVVTNFHVVQDV